MELNVKTLELIQRQLNIRYHSVATNLSVKNLNNFVWGTGAMNRVKNSTPGLENLNLDETNQGAKNLVSTEGAKNLGKE